MKKLSRLESCDLCPRRCKVNRYMRPGFCGAGSAVRLARAALHKWEEPTISVGAGSGTIFFSGCPLRCIYCQNYEIAHAQTGLEISIERLSAIMLELQDIHHAANINLVTATQYVPHIIEAIDMARQQGLILPIVYNSSSYESLETIELLRGYVDIYLADIKYMSPDLAQSYSSARDYPYVAHAAIKAMYEQLGCLAHDYFGSNMEKRLIKGVVIRHLVLPGSIKDSYAVLDWIHQHFAGKIALSIMSQYTPLRQFESYPWLEKRLSEADYEKVLDYADDLGLEYFWQEGTSAQESFIPAFDLTGVKA